MKKTAWFALLLLGCDGSPVPATATLTIRGYASADVLLVDESENRNVTAKIGPEGRYEFPVKGADLNSAWGKEKTFRLQVPAEIPAYAAWASTDSFTLREDLNAPPLSVWDPKVEVEPTPEGGLRIRISPPAPGLTSHRAEFRYRNAVNRDETRSERIAADGASFTSSEMARILPDRGNPDVLVWVTAYGNGRPPAHFPNFPMGPGVVYHSRQAFYRIPIPSTSRPSPNREVAGLLRTWAESMRTLRDDQVRILGEVAKLGDAGRTAEFRERVGATFGLVALLRKLLGPGKDIVPDVDPGTDLKDGTWLYPVRGLEIDEGPVRSVVVEESGGRLRLKELRLNGATRNPAVTKRLPELLPAEVRFPHWVASESALEIPKDRSTARAAAGGMAALKILEQTELTAREDALLRKFLNGMRDVLAESAIRAAEQALDREMKEARGRFVQLQSNVESVDEKGETATAILRTNAGYSSSVSRRVVLRKVGAEWLVDGLQKACTCTREERPSCKTCGGTGWEDEP